MKAVFKSGTGKGPSEQFVVTYLMGDMVFSEGDLGTEMYIVQSGVVEIFKKIRGRQKVLATLEKGDFFGEMSVLEDVSRTASARAKTDVELVRINQTTFDQMIKSNTEIAVRMLRKLSRRLRETTELLEDALGHKVPEPIDSPSGSLPAVAREEHRVYRLVTPDKKTEFYLNRDGDTRIGRADPVTGINPDVDLTALDTQRSTSRSHARIYKSDDTFYVMEEIGVMNGTYVNDRRLPTGSPGAVKDGDVLKFGLIPLIFRVTRE
ncbi:MAG TPA: cyclic nucleotide-binding domain-containing protein [Thermoanaerobaculia bacterium]|nr:cyclic nucleotide-binding domain-containing protein [Thermoanaerobaculia bacterium]